MESIETVRSLPLCLSVYLSLVLFLSLSPFHRPSLSHPRASYTAAALWTVRRPPPSGTSGARTPASPRGRRAPGSGTRSCPPSRGAPGTCRVGGGGRLYLACVSGRWVTRSGWAAVATVDGSAGCTASPQLGKEEAFSCAKKRWTTEEGGRGLGKQKTGLFMTDDTPEHHNVLRYTPLPADVSAGTMPHAGPSVSRRQPIQNAATEHLNIDTRRRRRRRQRMGLRFSRRIAYFLRNDNSDFRGAERSSTGQALAQGRELLSHRR